MSKLVIIVPAHNEEYGIAETLASLLLCSNASIVVVADNCSDKTAEIASKMGVSVIERNDPVHLGKPKAIAFALATLQSKFDYFAFVDADTVVEPNFADVLLKTFECGADAVQVKYVQRQEAPKLWQRFLDISFTASNVVRPMGRQYWGLSCGILGNGFALTKQTLEQVPLKVDSMVEDLVYHLRLVTNGKKVIYAPETTVEAIIPANAQAVKTQRERWEGGRFSALKTEALPLFKNICKGDFRLIEPLFDLLLQPLALHTLFLIILLLLPIPIIHTYAWMAILIVFLYTVVAIIIRKEGWKDWAALGLAPFYIIWKASMLPKIISSAKNGSWKRTERKKENP